MSKLFIAEKPELAKAIATGMNGNILRKDGYFQVGDNIVTWAYGSDAECKTELYASDLIKC